MSDTKLKTMTVQGNRFIMQNTRVSDTKPTTKDSSRSLFPYTNTFQTVTTFTVHAMHYKSKSLMSQHRQQSKYISEVTLLKNLQSEIRVQFISTGQRETQCMAYSYTIILMSQV